MGFPDSSISQLIALAKAEDLGDGDKTTQLLSDASQIVDFELVAKQHCVVAGMEIAPLVLTEYDSNLALEWSSGCKDGAAIQTTPTTLARIRGALGSLLAAERVLLNFLQRLCGVATLTRAFVDAVEGTQAKIFDTRKTTPGWRALEKYAVRCGGGHNHRQGLFDAILIKDNHLAGVHSERLAGVVFEMLNRIPSADKPAFIEVEAANLVQMKELCKVVGIDIILLDNFSVAELAQAVEFRDEMGLRGKVELEASGGVSLRTVRAIAQTGVERISVGAITHSATAIDISLERI